MIEDYISYGCKNDTSPTDIFSRRAQVDSSDVVTSRRNGDPHSL